MTLNAPKNEIPKLKLTWTIERRLNTRKKKRVPRWGAFPRPGWEEVRSGKKNHGGNAVPHHPKKGGGKKEERKRRSKR